MKIVLIYPEEAVLEKIVDWLERERRHVVVWAQRWQDDLPALLARHEPDCLLMPEGTLHFNMDIAAAQRLFPDCNFCYLPNLTSSTNGQMPAALEPVVAGAEAAYRARQLMARPYAAEKRYIIHDPANQEFASSQKLHTPKRKAGRRSVAAQQEAMFLLQLQAATTDDRHAQAKRYLSVLLHFDRALERESAYRLAHGSFKISWLREQIARWMTVLAYYIPGAEVEHCIAPQNPSPRCAYLHHEIPLIAFYPIFCCIISFGIRQSIAEQIKAAVPWVYKGEDEAALVKTGIFLFGLNGYLREVAKAQVWAMGQFLNPNSPFHRAKSDSRSRRRNLQVYLEFWGWDYLRAMGPELRRITSAFHSGTTRVKRPAGETVAPSFYEFRQVLIAASPDS
jgi:hypothetical protein